MAPPASSFALWLSTLISTAFVTNFTFLWLLFSLNWIRSCHWFMHKNTHYKCLNCHEFLQNIEILWRRRMENLSKKPLKSQNLGKQYIHNLYSLVFNRIIFWAQTFSNQTKNSLGEIKWRFNFSIWLFGKEIVNKMFQISD